MQPPSPLPLQGALLRPRITQPNFPTSWVHTKGRRGLVWGGHSIALPTRFTAARAKSQRTKRGEAAGRGLGAARGEGRQRDPHPRAPQPHAATPTPPLQPRTRGMDPLHGAVGGGGRHAAFGVILSFPPRHLPPRPSPARDAPDFSSS